MYLGGMLHLARTRLALAGLIAAGALTGCTTPKVEPQLSQAVIDARVRAKAPPPSTCPTDPIGSISPLTVGFAFNDVELTPAVSRLLDGPARWLTCHPQTTAVILPDADTHGTPAEQDKLARQRAEAVYGYLTARGVQPAQLRILGRAAAEPTRPVLLIRAEGRRW